MNTSVPIASTLDRDALLDRVGGDEELLREITSIFLLEYPALLRQIQDGLSRGDTRRIELAAHSLKGSVANFGVPAAIEAAHRLEVIGRSGSIAEAPAAIAHLVTEFQRLQPLLEQLGA